VQLSGAVRVAGMLAGKQPALGVHHARPPRHSQNFKSP
jgi:hypothetical protein